MLTFRTFTLLAVVAAVGCTYVYDLEKVDFDAGAAPAPDAGDDASAPNAGNDQ